ncbi:MAG: sortase [Anaerolineae bacterium]|nr:sortase [Anaerolineae bacterium]
MKLSNSQILIEQIALLFASLVWTIVVLVVISMFWVYQDVQTRWNFVLHAPPEALAQAAPPTATPSPTMTPWRGPGPTMTPTATKPPTPTATRVVQPPDILPETLNADDPLPVVVDGGEQASTAPPTPLPTLISPHPEQNPSPPPAASPPEAPQPDVVEENIPTRLIIESVGIDAVVVPVGWYTVEQGGRQYSIWQVADNAVGWHETSAHLGQPGNSVMTGHHNVKGEVFRDLVNVEVGDKVVVYAGNHSFEYQIELKTIVKEKDESLEARQRNAQWIAATDDERLTFVTCWPYTNNTHRVIVVAKPL